MNKIIQINLAGQAVSIDEQAYAVLSQYLRTLENHFRNTEDGKEILEDIEARIAELFYGKIKKGNAFINQQDVDEAIQLMGTPEDMGIDEDTSQRADASQSYTYTMDKKLFRDTDDRVLGGVCSGLAAYFSMDTSVVRIVVILLILFTGIPLFAYFILWIVLPEATTPEDRSRMRGGNTTVNDIVNNVRREATDVARNVKKEASEVADSLKKNSNLKSSGRSVVNGLEQVIRFFAKLFGAVVLTALVAMGIAFSVFLISNAAGGLHFPTSQATVVLPTILISPTLNWILSISLLSLVLIPIGTLCYAIVLFIFNSYTRVNLKAVFISWLISLAVFIGISIYSVGNINTQKFKDFEHQMRDKKIRLGHNRIYYEEKSKKYNDGKDTMHIELSTISDQDTSSATLNIITP